MLARLVAFYRLQAHLLWNWRRGRRALLWRALGSFVVSFAAFGAAVWVVPGIHVRDLTTVAAAVVVLALLNLLVRPVVLVVAARFSVYAVALAVLLVQVYLLLALRDLVPGLVIDGFVDALVGSWVYAVVNLFLSAVLSIGEDESYYGTLVRLLVTRTTGAERSDRPGLVIVQLDGLSHSLLLHQVRAGRVPVIARWIGSGRMHLERWETLLPSQTSASQAGILHGNNDGIPAFRWYEKPTGRLLVSNHPADAAEIGRRVSNGQGLLSHDGASIGTLLTGDATRSYLTIASLAAGPSGLGDSVAFSGFFFSPYGYLHTAVLAIAEAFKEVVQAQRQARAGIEPRLPRGLPYPLMRAATNVVLRGLSTSLVVEEMYRGTSVIYVTYTDHDEIAHHSGPERSESLDAIDGLDRVLGSLEKAAEDAPRPYRFVVLSDHGQSLGATFRQRYDRTLEDTIHGLMGGRASIEAATARVEEWGPISAFLSEFTGLSGAGPALARVATRKRRIGRVVELGPAGPGGSVAEPGPRRGGGPATGPGPGKDAGGLAGERGPAAAPDLVVCASGNLALVYFNVAPERLTLEVIADHYPGLVEALASHPGIGIVLVRSATRGAVALGRAGLNALDERRIVGHDPLAPYGPHAAESLLRLDGIAHVGDLVLISLFDPETAEVAAFEELIGSHGGLGGPQTEAFLLHPADWSVGPEPLVGAPTLYRLLRRWLGEELGIELGPEAPA